jgi:hypothetical protein
VISSEGQRSKAPTNLHPYTRPLTISDLESVVALENAAFPNPNDRATREKVSVSQSNTIMRWPHDLELSPEPPPAICLSSVSFPNKAFSLCTDSLGVVSYA